METDLIVFIRKNGIPLLPIVSYYFRFVRDFLLSWIYRGDNIVYLFEPYKSINFSFVKFHLTNK